MGYDMYVENPDPADQERKDLLYPRLYGKGGLYGQGRAIPDSEHGTKVDPDAYPWWAGHTAGDGSPAFEAWRDQIEIAHREYEEVDARLYFRLNIWGMGTAREELFRVHVMTDVDHSPWPTPEDYGLSEYVYADLKDGAWIDEETEQPITDQSKLDYLEARRQVRDGIPEGDACGIPLYKVSSNDGWLVTPGEIRTGIAWADHHHDGWRENLTPYVREFVIWMEYAASRGGFRVH